MFPQIKFPYGVDTAVQPFRWAQTNNLQQIEDLQGNFIIYQLSPETRDVAIPVTKSPTFTENTDTIRYSRVEAEAPEKEGQNSVTLKQFAYSLEQNYPNPFNPETIISYSIKKHGMTTLRIFDINGRMVGELVNKVMEPGEYTITFKPEKHLSSGVYLIELVSGEYRSVQKAMLLK